MSEGLVHWKRGRPSTPAPFAVVTVDVDNIVGQWGSLEDAVAKIERAMKQVHTMVTHVATRAHVFAFVQLWRPRPISDAFDQACRTYGFKLVHCPRRETDGTDDVDAHMKTFLADVPMAYTDDIPILVLSGDHTFAKEIAVVGRTHTIYVGSRPGHTSHELHNDLVKGIAWFIPHRTDKEKIAMLLGTSPEPAHPEALRDILREERWRIVWAEIQMGRDHLVQYRRGLLNHCFRRPMEVLANELAGRRDEQREVGQRLARFFCEEGIVTIHEAMGTRRLSYRIEVNFDHPLFRAQRPEPFRLHLADPRASTVAASAPAK